MAPLAAAVLFAILAASALAAPTQKPSTTSSNLTVRKQVSALVPEVPTRVLSKVSGKVEPISVAPQTLSQGPQPINQLQAALDFVQGELSITKTTFGSYIVKDSYTTKHNGLLHVYLRQVVNGLEVINGDINVNVLENGSILSYGNSFFTGNVAPEPDAPSVTPKLSAMDALQAFGSFIGEQVVPRDKNSWINSNGAEEVPLDENSALIRNVAFAKADIQARRVYIQTEENDLRLGWELSVPMTHNWFYAIVDELNGEILNVNDWTAQAAPVYRVLPFGVEDPDHGQRELVTKTANFDASPLGWHDNGATKFSDTRGNNVNAAFPVSRRPEGGEDLVFDFPAELGAESPYNYYEASATQLFHTVNRYHDLLYQLGFDEVSGNFQTENFGKGGKGGDAVIATALSGGMTDNAQFTTPADGSAGSLNMYIWTQTSPFRDPDFQQSIVIHEYTHGLSNRLTGGPSNVNCLPSGEAGGLGEGWGDVFGYVLGQKAEYTRYTSMPAGAYVMGNTNGVRRYPYTSDLKVNPETYKYISKLSYREVHSRGEVWAGILHEVYWNLREAKGFEPDLFSIDISTPEARKNAKGDVIFMLNLIDGMKTQTCKPNFVQARDAILAADAVNFGGENICTMWKGFAVRGLGYSAKKGGSEAYDLPAACK